MKSNQTIEQVIKTVTNSPSTIFHKDDVLMLISGIEVTKGATMTTDQIENIASEIANRIDRDRDNICTLESVTVSAGNYGSDIEESSFNMDEDRISDIALEVLTDYITPADDDSTDSENNDTVTQ